MNLALMALLGGGAAALYYGYKKKDPSVEMSSCFFDRIAVPVYSLMRDFDSNNGLIVDEVGKDYATINVPAGRLYGIELRGGDTVPNYLTEKDIEILSRTYKVKDNGYFYIAMLKSGRYHKQYLFSHNQAIVKYVAGRYDAKPLSGLEIVNALFDLFLDNSYYIDLESKQIKRTMEINLQDDLVTGDDTFRKLARTAVHKSLKDIDILQGYKAINVPTTDLQELYSLEFEGAVWVYIDFNKTRIENYITRMLTLAKWSGGEEKFKELKEAYAQKKVDLAIINAVALMKEYEESIVGTLGTDIKTAMVKKDLFRKDIIRKTPLKYRDTDFDYLVGLDYLHNYIAPIHKRMANKPDIWGYDHQGGFINYSFSEENDNPHSVIIARTGSGKTVSKQKIISQMIGLDYETGYAKYLGATVKVRNYDVGYSDEKYVNLIASNPDNSVAIIESDFDDFSYNLVNIDNDENGRLIESDLQFASDLASIILESQNSEPLTIAEQAAFKESVRTIYARKKYKDRRIRFLEKRNKKIYDELLQKGYGHNDPISSIDGYDFLKKPLLEDVIGYVAVESENQQLKDSERKAYATLAEKLRNIERLELFSYYDNIDIKFVDFLSMDLNNFKESSLFTPIFLCIFQKTYLADRAHALECKRKGIAAPKLLYPIEEAKNFFRIPYFEVMLEKLALEARKYNVHLMFIVQNAEHVPMGILKNIDTKMFLLAPDRKNEIIDEIKKHFSPPAKVIQCLEGTRRYELCVWYSGGVFNINFDISDKELNLYNTNPNKVEK